VVGAGICGLAHALAAARCGKRVVVLDRDAQANGASIRNFGFITVTGQQAGTCWRRAKRSAEVWLEIADAAKIPLVQRGLLTIARRPEARAVIEAFLQTDMGAECRLIEPQELNNYGSGLRTGEFAGALYSPHEARVESREAIPQLAAWLGERFPVTFLRETDVADRADQNLHSDAHEQERRKPHDDMTGRRSDSAAGSNARFSPVSAAMA
jgi:D-hydroxyproline dehydrogenase subunit beta